MIRLRRFINTKGGGVICPKCGSVGRTRKLYTLFDENFENKKILHFSPPKSLYKELSKRFKSNYYASDFLGEFESNYNYDLLNLDVSDGFFDIIICYHVLEHIENDLTAISELFRVLDKDGFCIIQTPFKEGDIFEDSSATSELERLSLFGQKDHYRIYSVEGLKRRLENVGFVVSIDSFIEQSNNYHGFKKIEFILYAKKS